jgi:hypothetical protein
MDVVLKGRYYQPKSVKYLITEDGKIFREVKTQPTGPQKSYLNAHLGRGIRWTVHRLVCTLWHGEPKEGQVCRHLDNDPANNHFSNLKWGSMSENAIDTRDANYSKQQKITKEIADEIRDFAYRWGYGYRIIAAKRYGISEAHITEIVAGRVWK